jgi:uncharacterized protein YutE (UPF0331/DUF86 family)
MTTALELFQANFNACQQRIAKLSQSLDKANALLPLTTVTIQAMTDAQEETIDALILRYSQCVSMMQDHLFRGIALIEQEDISDKSNRDKALLMEKIGAIKSADAFGTAAILRNKFAHHYPEDAADRVDRMNLIVLETALVIRAFQEIKLFAHARNYLVVQPSGN